MKIQVRPDCNTTQACGFWNQEKNSSFLKELKIEYRAYFESLLAISILTDKAVNSTIEKVSESIVRLLKQNKNSFLEICNKEPRIGKYLSDINLIGYLEKKPLTELCDYLINILKSKSASIEQVLHIHEVFVYLIYPALLERPSNIEKEKTTHDLLSPHSLFSEVGRGRKEITNPSSTTNIGITKNKYYSRKLIGQWKPCTPHIRALDKFEPIKESAYYQKVVNDSLPFVSGPSGHARSVLQGALLYGNLNGDEFKEYALACFAFYALAGNHSFDEVMCVAKHAGINYERGDYLSALPKSYILSDAFKALADKFPEFLTPTPTIPKI